MRIVNVILISIWTGTTRFRACLATILVRSLRHRFLRIGFLNLRRIFVICGFCILGSLFIFFCLAEESV